MPKSSSSLSPTITPMNPIHVKCQTLALGSDAPDDPLFTPYHHQSSYPESLLLTDDSDPNPTTLLLNDDDDDEFPGDIRPSDNPPPEITPNPAGQQLYIDPAPHISSQFYTFNGESHALMIQCIIEGRLATAAEIRFAIPCSILHSWRSVWKDRNEDTAYVTAWKRIQDKLAVDGDALHFKSNRAQRVSHFGQWHEIIAAAHADADLRHLGLKETVERIKQNWTVGAKFYGIPESFIRVSVMSCPVCSGARSPCRSGGGRNKRRRFEYTESFDVPARNVQQQLQHLATMYKVVLCIRQKYIRYKPFLAEVKDYACHRAGEPTSSSVSSKKARILKREPYTSKRCGCGFRIRAIVPISNYNDKDKSFVYEEEGTAVFKLYAVHSGHEPGPLDGSARIIHRLVGQKVGFDQEQEVFGVREDMEMEPLYNLSREDDENDAHVVLQQVKELKAEVCSLEGKIAMIPQEQLRSLSHDLSEILNRIRTVGESHHLEEPMPRGEEEVEHWENNHDPHLGDEVGRIFGSDLEIIEEANEFDATLGSIVPWDRMEADCVERKIPTGTCKSDKWLIKEDFDEGSILNCREDGDKEESKLIKHIQHDGGIATDPCIEGIHVTGFYTHNGKWYDSPGILEDDGDTSDIGFRNERIV